MTGFLDGVAGTPATDTTTSTLADVHAVRIGTYDDDQIFGDFEVYAAVVWREALSDVDLLLVSQQLLSTGPSNLLLLGVG